MKCSFTFKVRLHLAFDLFHEGSNMQRNIAFLGNSSIDRRVALKHWKNSRAVENGDLGDEVNGND